MKPGKAALAGGPGMFSIAVGRGKGCAGEATASWRLEIDPWLVARKRTSVQITTVVRLSQNGYGRRN